MTSLGIPFDFDYFLTVLTHGALWEAAKITLLLAILVWATSIILGLPIALMLRSKYALVRVPAEGYVWVSRALPPLLVVIFTYTGLPLLVPPLEVALSSPFVAGYVALVFTEAGFMAEVFRGSLLGVEAGQREGAKALGMSRVRMNWYVILPQAFRIALPAVGNMFVGTLKGTSLISVISLAELTLVAQQTYSQNFKVLEVLTAAAIVYLVIASGYLLSQRLLEARLDTQRRGSRTQGALPALPELDGGGVDRKHHEVGDDAGGGRLPENPAAGIVTSNPGERRCTLEATGLTKRFGGREVLHGIDLSVGSGEVSVLIGPSGSGKTTLLRCLAGLETVDAGAIRLREVAGGPDAKDVLLRGASGTRIGLVFQRFNLFPHMTALDNVAVGPRVVQGQRRQDARAKARALLTRLGLAEHVTHYPHQLSGGQQQRVAIARALAMEPDVLLFDEPTSALDPELVNEVVSVVAQLRDEGLTMVIVSHEMRFVRRVADTVVMLESGSVVECGKSDQIFDEPREPRTRLFVSRLG